MKGWYKMDIKKIKETSKKIEVFIKMCENSFGEDEHGIKKPLTYNDFEDIQELVNKLNNCINYVDGNIFE